MAAEATTAASTSATAAAASSDASAAAASSPAPTTEGPSSADKKGPRGSANLGSKKKPSINTSVVDKAPKPEEEQADALLKKKRESQLKRQSMPEQLKATLSDMKEKNAAKN